MANALSFLADPEYWRSVRETASNSLGKLAQGMVAGTVGAMAGGIAGGYYGMDAMAGER